MTTAARKGRKALVVLGMHRSGTSALARVLSLRGAALPRQVLPPNAGNEKGYWEPERVVALNERILQSAGLAWNDAFAPGALEAAGAVDPGFLEEARAIIASDYGDASLLVLKDPRCTLLQAFWREALGGMGISMLPVVISRPPGEVVASLVRRDGTSAIGAGLLYAAYGVAAARAPAPAAFLTYEALLEDWRAQTDRVGRELGVEWPRLAPGAESDIARFLDRPGKAAAVPVLPADVASICETTWQCLARQATGQGCDDDALDAVQTALEQRLQAVEPLLRDKNLGWELLSRQRDAALAERDRVLAVFEATEAEMHKAQADHARAQEALEQARRAAGQLVGERDTALGERDQALLVFKQAEAELRKAQADHARAEAEFGRAREDAARVVNERDTALRERDDALAVFRKAETELRKAQADHARAQSELELARNGALEVIAARDSALRERDEALAVFRSTEAELRKAQADHATVAAECDAVRAASEAAGAERDALQAERDTLQAERDTLQSERDSLQSERDSLLELYRRTDALLRKAQGDYAAMERRAQLLEGEYRQVATFARDLMDSRSWRMTRPLRAVTRRLHGLASADPVLPVFGASAPAWSPQVDAPAMEGGDDAPPPSQVPQSLNDFLFDEFGPEAAADVTARIRHYRLPVDTREVRSAAALACSEEQAVAWAHALSAKPRPDGEGAPDVSIVVPVYNQVAFTLAAIDSLLSHVSRYSFEVLVGDDASTDATAAALAKEIPGVRHLRHAQNLGFVRNCNATAARARGRYVLFLNNDTQVLPGWLDELIGTLEDDPQVGLAGSKLVYPDGRLQECGAIVWRDGSAWNFGRLQDPRRPEFCYRRDVDYVSGASIALRRDLWEALGGFDELFVPAYAEDADLAFRVRAHGLRTVVQPLSQILHFEGISSGTDLGAGAKAYQVDNLRKLHERWKDVLATHRENADAPELEKERGVRGRVLFVDHCTPTPNEDAGSTVAFETMRGFLANGYKVTFIPEDNFAHVGAPTRALQRIGVEAIYHPAYSRMEQFLAQRSDPFDALFLHRFGVGEAHMPELRRHYPGARVLFLNADMHHLRELREAELSGDAGAMARAEATRERELAVVGAADATLVHSEFEQALLGKELPGADVILYPLIHDPVAEVAPLEGRSGVCFVGGFRHPPNADGIRWFVENAWPRVRARRPDAMLYVVGSHATPEVLALDGHAGVVVEGFVDDLEAYLARRRASVAPLRYGAGAKGKVAQSLALGLPVAGTGIATEGMGLRAGEEVLVADTPDALAGHVLRLLEDDDAWHRLSARGLAWAARTTSRASAHERLRRLLDA